MSCAYLFLQCIYCIMMLLSVILHLRPISYASLLGLNYSSLPIRYIVESSTAMLECFTSFIWLVGAGQEFSV